MSDGVYCHYAHATGQEHDLQVERKAPLCQAQDARGDRRVRLRRRRVTTRPPAR